MRFSPSRLLDVGPVSLTVASVALVGALFSTGVPIFDLIELRTYDLRVRSRGRLEPSPAVALAVIDEKSLDTEGRWPRLRHHNETGTLRTSQCGIRLTRR